MQARSLGPHCEDCIMPVPNTKDSVNYEYGCRKRIGAMLPVIDEALMTRFENFVVQWLQGNCTPLQNSDVLTVDKWLEETHYPEWRKVELREAWDGCHHNLRRRHYRLKSFIKQERLDSVKPPRIINSRSDCFKCATGPAFHAIERSLFYGENSYLFIKSVPVCDRPTYIKKSIECPGRRYLSTDFSSFEGSFSARLMKACEFKLYEHMLSRCDAGRLALTHIKKALAGKNIGQSRLGRYTIGATRMSGDMCTSLGNGFTNLMVTSFVMEESGVSDADWDGLFEGDDGIMSVTQSKIIDQTVYSRLGFKIKLEQHTELCTASFCGNVFDPEELQNTCSIDEMLSKFGWTLSPLRFAGARVCLQLLKAKAMSLLYEFGGCPVAQALGRYVLRCTEGVIPRWSDEDMSWSFKNDKNAREIAHKNVLRVVGPATRQVVARKFGYPIELQLRVEKWLDEQTTIKPIPSWAISHPNVEWRDQYRRNVVVCDVKETSLWYH